MRTMVGSLVGLLAGSLLAGALLRLTVWIVRITIEPPLAVNHGVIYLGVILGGGFGAVCGGLAGLASTLSRLLRQPPSTSATPPGS
jgi:hypothetical protein